MAFLERPQTGVRRLQQVDDVGGALRLGAALRFYRGRRAPVPATQGPLAALGEPPPGGLELYGRPG